MIARILAIIFAFGVLLYVVAFFLPAVWDHGRSYRGLDSTFLSLAALSFYSDPVSPGQAWYVSFLKTISAFFVVLINPMFLIYAAASPFRPADRTVRVCRVAVPLFIPFCWLLFHWESVRPQIGHYVWIIGMVSVLASGFRVNSADSSRG